MNRRDFLKTAGLVALTAPVGVAALRATLTESEIDALKSDAAKFDKLRGACGETAGKLRKMGTAADGCARAFAAIPFVEDGELLTAGRLNSIVDAVNRQAAL